MGSRTWIKIYCDKWLEGTIRDETLAVRAIWIDLLALAGSGRYGDIGEIKLGKDIGLFDSQIAAILEISNEIWLTTKQRLIMTERITVSKGNTITITNWTKYQSEYERVRRYTIKTTAQTTDEYHKENRIDKNRIDINIKEGRDRRVTLIGVAYKKKRGELGRELTTEERLAIEAEVDKKLNKEVKG